MAALSGFTVVGTPVFSTSGASSYAYGSFTPSGSKAIAVAVLASGTAGTTTPSLDTPTWLDGSWELFENPGTTTELLLFVGKTVASPGADGFTVDFDGDAQTGICIVAFQWDNADLADLVVDGSFAENEGTGTNTMTATVGALASAENAILAVFGTEVNEAMTAGGGGTEITGSDGGYTSPTRRIMVAHGVNDNSITASWTTPSAFYWLAVELKAASGSTLKSVTDSGSGSETVTETASYQNTDAISGGDVSALTGLLPGTDAGAGDEAGQTLISQPVTDTGAGAEIATETASYQNTDAVAGGDVSALTGLLPGTDAGAGADSAGLGFFVTDTGAGADIVAALTALLGTVDAATAAETPAASANLPITDAGSGSETPTETAALSATDSGSGLEVAQASIAFNVTEAGTGADLVQALNALIPPTDSGSLSSEQATLTASLSAVDVSGSVQETASLVAALLVNDSGSGADVGQQSQAIIVADTGTSLDSALLAAILAPTDLASVTETAVQVVALVTSDTGSDVEQVLLNAAYEVIDASAGVLENAIVTIEGVGPFDGLTGVIVASRDLGQVSRSDSPGSLSGFKISSIIRRIP